MPKLLQDKSFNAKKDGVIHVDKFHDFKQGGNAGSANALVRKKIYVSDILNRMDIDPYHQYQHLRKYTSTFPDAKSHREIKSLHISPLDFLPIESTGRNTEMLHLFIQRLAPFVTSIDGQDPPKIHTQWISFLVQSPMASHMGILTAEYFKALAEGISIEQSIDAIATRIKTINLINESLRKEQVTDEAMAAVMSLAYNELIYTSAESVLAHMKGLRSMVHLRGGLHVIHPPILRKFLLR
ncbi:hypothetical protein NHQ30_004841 [Ciborinia camelliae]|nr:hypothetical protein NHQ30_004841 [Ciborinia camelliae]